MDFAEKIKELEKKLEVVEKNLAEDDAMGLITGVGIWTSAWCRLTDEIEKLKARQKLGGGE